MHIYKILQILYTVLRLVSIQSLYPIFCAPFSIQLSSEVSHIYKICKITYTNPAVFAHIQDLYAHLHIYKICTDIQTYISENSPIFYQKSPILSQKSPVFSQKRSAFLFTHTRYAQIYVSAWCVMCDSWDLDTYICATLTHHMHRYTYLDPNYHTSRIT